MTTAVVQRGMLRAATAVWLLTATSSEAGRYAVRPTGALLVVVQGTATALGPRARPLGGQAAAGLTSDARVLFDGEAAAEDCAQAGGLAEPLLRRVIAVRPLAAGLSDQTTTGSASAWDAAYDSLTHVADPSGLVGPLVQSGAEILAVEPDLVWTDVELETLPSVPAAVAAAQAGDTHGVSALPDDHWPVRDEIGWHLVASQLADARRLVEQRLPSQPRRVVIAHLDTGYPRCEDSGLPPRLRRAASWDFSGLSCPDRCDPAPGAEEPETSQGNHGHGTGTLSILAGGPVRATPPGGETFDGSIGGAPFADVLEYRIADSVVVWQPSKIARALEQAVHDQVDVVSMSMGGPPNFTLHQAVNQAYCRGVAMFMATGNNVRHPLLWVSSPRTTVFPARYDRVIGVAGITGDDRTYARAPWRWEYLVNPCQYVMRGNVGPRGVMDEVLTAFTPNVPWLDRPSADCSRHSLRLNGAGTSAATPQVAAAAAAWLQYYSDDLRHDWRSWQKTEAVYEALLEAADDERPRPHWDVDRFGAGSLRAAKAIEKGIPHELRLRRPAALGWWWVVDLLLSSLGPAPLSTEETQRRRAVRNMLATEIAQLVVTSSDVAAVLDAAERDAPAGSTRDALAALRDDPHASTTLRRMADAALRQP